MPQPHDPQCFGCDARNCCSVCLEHHAVDSLAKRHEEARRGEEGVR